MKSLIVFLMMLPILCFMIFQPFYENAQFMKGIIIQQELNRAIKDVAREGMLTTEASFGTSSIESKIKTDLANLKLNSANIKVNSTTSSTRVMRGGYVDLEIRYPRGINYIFKNFWGTDSINQEYIYRTSEMSEYIP